MLKKTIYVLYFFLGFMANSPEMFPADSPKVKIVLSPLTYLKESDVKASDEALVRASLRASLLNSAGWNVSLIADSLIEHLGKIDRAKLRSLGMRHKADFVISGQMDVIDEDNWAISFEVISTESSERDTTFNADPSAFKMKGELDEVIQSGCVEKMRDMIQSYILSIRQKTPWWKKSKVLIAGGMVGTATVGFIVTEILRNKKRETRTEEKDLPVSPDPPK